jgi:aspartyl/asparaginyl-tRNA synthetase
MQRILSHQLSEHVGETVRVAGWVHRRRLLKSVAFLILRDASGLAQIVVSDENARAQLEELPEETTITAIGTVIAQPTAPGGVELTSPNIEALTEQPVVVHFADVLEMISKATGADVTGEPDLAPAHERWIGEWAQREHGSDFVFVEATRPRTGPSTPIPTRTGPGTRGRST